VVGGYNAFGLFDAEWFQVENCDPAKKHRKQAQFSKPAFKTNLDI